MDIGIPTDVLTFLHETKKISAPWVAANDLDLRWVEELDWAFRCEFHWPYSSESMEAGCVLVLDRIDCWAEIFLNGKPVGSTENLFREQRFYVDEFLQQDTNELLVYIRSAKLVSEALERVHGNLPAAFDTARVHARRCQCWTGWDWARRLSSAGILKSPAIEFDAIYRLVSPYAYVREMAPVEPGQARADWSTIVVQADIVAQRRAKGKVLMEIIDADGQTVARAENMVTLAVGRATTRMSFRLRETRLWWPLGYGERPLYRARMVLDCEDRAGTSFFAETSTEFGCRTVSIQRRKDKATESFTPLVNGVPVFCRGANWIPVSMLPGSVTTRDYLRLLNAAAAAGMNCLRVWGGGIYEDDCFYDICDSLGILVWQDFMFACAAYPVYREILDEIDQEADHQICRLRNHPSLLLWCGNNENEWIHQRGGLRRGEERRIIGEQIWSSLLKDKVEELDPSRFYQQSSPYGRNRDDFNDAGSGDRHNWQVWGEWASPDAYLADTGRFISEFGVQSVPCIESIRDFAPGADELKSPVLLHHQLDGSGNGKIVRYVDELYDLPRDLEGWAEASQRFQAEVLRCAVEHWRRMKPSTSGVLVWQLNDAYPAISWSLIDFYGRMKLAYDFSCRFFAPVLVSVALLEGGREVVAFPVLPAELANRPAVQVSGEPDEAPAALPDSRPLREVEVTVVNDTAHPLEGTLLLSVVTADGSETRSSAVPTRVEANANTSPLRLSLEETGLTDLRGQFLRVVLQIDETTQNALDRCAEQIRSSIWAATLRYSVSDPSEITPAIDCCRALVAEVLPVAPKYFNWTDQTRVLGLGRPGW